MGRRIFFDGLNLALADGTGIATYTRLLIDLVRGAGDEVGLVYSVPRRPGRHRDEIELIRLSRAAQRRRRWPHLIDRLRALFGVAPAPIWLSDRLRGQVPEHDYLFAARNLFDSATGCFSWTGRLTELRFAVQPDLLHCTYPLPIRAKGACNVYTIHDLIPLRLPHTTLDRTRQFHRLLNRIAAEADHIVTVSENSKRDIVELLKIDASRVTNTYQAVDFPREYLERRDDVVAEQLERLFRLEAGKYLLFCGAIEPKKNVEALLHAFLLSNVGMPLVLAGARGWRNRAETELLERVEQREQSLPGEWGRVRQLGFVDRSVLVSLIKGARAVVFPSLYEGFGLPVLEAMTLGTPVVTSRVSSLPEIAGDAALYVDPRQIGDIARGIETIAADDGLCAELSRRGRKQAELFSVERYRDRVMELYSRLI